MSKRNNDLLKPRLGLGTSQMGYELANRAKEVAALRAGIETGVRRLP